MKDGWYSIQRTTDKEWVIHFVFNDGKSTLCKRNRDVTQLGKRIVSTEYDDKKYCCNMCVKSFEKYRRTGKRYVDSQIEKTHPHIQKGITKSTAQTTIETTDKFHLVETICPACGTEVSFYSAGKQREHHCTVCNEMVEIPMGIVLA